MTISWSQNEVRFFLFNSQNSRRFDVMNIFISTSWVFSLSLSLIAVRRRDVLEPESEGVQAEKEKEAALWVTYEQYLLFSSKVPAVSSGQWQGCWDKSNSSKNTCKLQSGVLKVSSVKTCNWIKHLKEPHCLKINVGLAAIVVRS